MIRDWDKMSIDLVGLGLVILAMTSGLVISVLSILLDCLTSF